VADLAQLAENDDAPQNLSLYMGPHHLVGTYVDAEITSRPHGVPSTDITEHGSWCCLPLVAMVVVVLAECRSGKYF